MRISFLALKGIPNGGGIEKLTEEIGCRLAKKGHKIVAIARDPVKLKDGQVEVIKNAKNEFDLKIPDKIKVNTVDKSLKMTCRNFAKKR